MDDRRDGWFLQRINYKEIWNKVFVSAVGFLEDKMGFCGRRGYCCQVLVPDEGQDLSLRF